MSTGAWIFMAASWALIFGLNIFYLSQFLRKRK